MKTKIAKESQPTSPNKESKMDILTTLLCALFALVKQRRITAENLRRFVECPERLNNDWATATVEEQLAAMEAVGLVGQGFGELQPEHLRSTLEAWRRGQEPGKERLELFLAEEAFRIGVEEGISVTQMRWFDGKDAESWKEKEDVRRIRHDERWRHYDAELLDIVRRGLAGARVSPYELVIRFGEGYLPSFHLLHSAGNVHPNLEERIRRENLTLSEMSDEELKTLAKSYWQPYLEEARRVVDRLSYQDLNLCVELIDTSGFTVSHRSGDPPVFGKKKP